MKFKTTAAAAIAAAMMAGAAGASTVTSIDLDRGVASTWTTVWDTMFDGENVKAVGEWAYTGTSGNTWNFTMTLDNTSENVTNTTGGDARLVSWGFNTMPTASSFLVTSPSNWTGGSGQGTVNVDHCAWSGNNCNGGGNTGLMPADDALAFAFSFTSDRDSITLDYFRTRYQSAGANDESISITASSTNTPSPIPLPAAGWMLLAGIGGLAAMRRRKASA